MRKSGALSPQERRTNRQKMFTMFLHSSRVLSFIGVFNGVLIVLHPVFIGAQQACSDAEHSFEVDFRLGKEEFQAFSWHLKQEAVSDPLFSEELKSFEQIRSNISQCIPRNECFDFSIDHLSPDQFQLRVDGKAIARNELFQYRDGSRYEKENGWFVLSTAVGETCRPTCGDGEALLDVEIFGGESRLNWRVEDATTRQEITACEQSIAGICGDWRRGVDVHREYRCLPVGKCYRIVLADEFWSAFDRAGDLPTFRATFDSVELMHVESFRFHATQFGNSCESCQDGEAFLETGSRPYGRWDLRWRMVYVDESVRAAESYAPVPFKDRKVDSFLPNSSYHDGDEATYSVSLDGKTLVEDRKFCEGVDGACPEENFELLVVGEKCPTNGLSAGAISGIALGGIVIVLLVIVSMRGKKASNASLAPTIELEASRSETEERNPT